MNNTDETFFWILSLPLWIFYWLATGIAWTTIKCNDWWGKIEKINNP